MTVADTAIWRYMDLARYVSLLDRGLFFAGANNFTDVWEGGLGGADLRRFREENARLSQAELQAQWTARLATKQDALARTGVSCWHRADHESAALWELYIPKGLGVAIRSTVGRLCASVAEAKRAIDAVNLVYSDYENLELGGDPIKLLAHKRMEFAHEHEIRFLVRFRDDELAAMHSLCSALYERRARVVSPWPPRPVIMPGSAYSSVDSTITRRVAPQGVHLETNLKLLLDRVVLALDVAYPTRRAVLAVTQAFGLDRHLIAESSVEMVPFDRVKFHEG